MVKECGPESKNTEYLGDSMPERFTGKYYRFSDDGDDVILCVDKSTYKVYGFWSDGTFDTFNKKSSEFTFDMAMMKLEKELGFEEGRKYTSLKKGTYKGAPCYTIRTSFTDAVGGTGKGSDFYVTKYSVKDLKF